MAYVSARLLQRSVNVGLRAVGSGWGVGCGESVESEFGGVRWGSVGTGLRREGSLKRAESGSFSHARSRAPSLAQRTASNISVLSAFPFPSVGSEMEAQIPSATGPGMPAVGDSEAAYGPYLPTSEVFKRGPASADSFLSFYRSSTGVLRSFSGRCGTCLTHVDLFDACLSSWGGRRGGGAGFGVGDGG